MIWVKALKPKPKRSQSAKVSEFRKILFLNGIEDLGFLELTTTDLVSRVISTSLTVKLHKLSVFNLGGLQDLAFADIDILEGENGSTSLCDSKSNDFGSELEEKSLKVNGGGLLSHDLEHLFTDGTDLRRLGIGGLLDLSTSLLSKPDGEEANEVAVGGFDVDMCLNQGLPFLDKRADLIRGEVHAVEGGEKVLSGDLFASELNLAEGVILVLVKITDRGLEHATLEGVVGVFFS